MKTHIPAQDWNHSTENTAISIWYALSAVAAGITFGMVFQTSGGRLDDGHFNWLAFIGGMVVACIANIPVIVVVNLLKRIATNAVELRLVAIEAEQWRRRAAGQED